MLIGFVALYAIFVVTVSATAVFVALFIASASRREMAYRVLKLVLGTATGAGGILAAVIKAHEAGLLP